MNKHKTVPRPMTTISLRLKELRYIFSQPSPIKVEEKLVEREVAFATSCTEREVVSEFY
jgi:hypothetical protein